MDRKQKSARWPTSLLCQQPTEDLWLTNSWLLPNLHVSGLLKVVCVVVSRFFPTSTICTLYNKLFQFNFVLYKPFSNQYCGISRNHSIQNLFLSENWFKGQCWSVSWIFLKHMKLCPRNYCRCCFLNFPEAWWPLMKYYWQCFLFCLQIIHWLKSSIYQGRKPSSTEDVSIKVNCLGDRCASLPPCLR